MPQEIERKFLVKGDFKAFAISSQRITQAYLNSHPERNVRIRIKGEKAYLTIKGISNTSGTSRYEWEKEISVKEAQQLLPLCEPGSIDKIRYLVPVANHTYEVDEFFGENEGLLIAEIELAHESESFEKPQWLGEEVTGNRRYYNSQLINNPYKNWK